MARPNVYSMMSREGLGDIYGNEIKTARVTLTAAQIRALNTTPQVLLSAPGPRFYNAVMGIFVTLLYSTAVFTGANNVEFRETDGTGTGVANDFTSARLNSGVNLVANVGGVDATRILNTDIVAVVPVANPGGAGSISTLSFTILYMKVKAY